jgi:hypothetical protein
MHDLVLVEWIAGTYTALLLSSWRIFEISRAKSSLLDRVL